MDALYHSPTTETSLSNPFRDHARRAKISLRKRMVDGRRLLSLSLALGSQAVDVRPR